MKLLSERNCRNLGNLLTSPTQIKIAKYFAQQGFNKSYNLKTLYLELGMCKTTVHNALITMHGKGLIRHVYSENGGRVATSTATVVPYEFTCLGCLAYIHVAFD